MLPVAADLLVAVERGVAAYALIPQHTASEPPAPGKWSAVQILGHLVDSASNNHQRFVRVRWQDDLLFVGYDQDAWVVAQDYASARWSEVVALWASYNRHLARLMTGLPVSVRSRVHTRHNLHELAWRTVGEGQGVTLDWFLEDYVGHLRHHLRQIDGILGTSVG